jgi:hypothetical protein
MVLDSVSWDYSLAYLHSNCLRESSIYYTILEIHLLLALEISLWYTEILRPSLYNTLVSICNFSMNPLSEVQN